MLKDLIRKSLYASGALGAYHRVRNADSLTVVMFHRTLGRDDPRWALCDPDYTLEDHLFAQSLAFFARHYRVVSLAEVVAAQRGERRLPPRALLISFDDGWADNVAHALPALRRAGLPAVMFVAADAVGAGQPFFQERLISAWRRGALSLPALARDIAEAVGGEPVRAEAALAAQTSSRTGVPAVLRSLIAALEQMPKAARDALLSRHAEAMDDGVRHMIDVEELAQLRAGAVEIGLHGKSHVAMTRAEDLDAELGGAMAALRAQVGVTGDAADDGAVCRTLSFPHGAFDAAIAERARRAGYALLFTSVPVLNAVGDAPSWLLGRTGYETDTVSDAQGRFRPERLAWYLFRRPVQRLQAEAFRR